MKRKYESEILQVLHEEMMDMHESGFISDARMREFDEMCLPEKALQDTTAHGDNARETVNVEHADLVTA